MPSLKTHCAISKKRTGYSFSELHKWIDESSKQYGYDHRKIRHSFNEREAKQIKQYWENKKGSRKDLMNLYCFLKTQDIL